MQLFKDYNKAARAHTASGGWLLIMDGGKQYGLTTKEEEVRALRDQAFLDQCEKYRCWDETKDPKAPRLLTRGLLDSNNEDQAPWLERCADAASFAMVGGIIVGYFDTKGEGEEWLVDAHAKAASEEEEA